MRLAVLVLAATSVAGQTTRVLHLSQDRNKYQWEELTRDLRDITEVERVSSDPTLGALSIAGSADAVAAADWMVRQLDLPPGGPFVGVHEYQLAADDAIRVLYLNHCGSMESMQFTVTAIHGLISSRHDNTYTAHTNVYNPLNAIIVRGGRLEVDLAAWLADQLDQPSGVRGPEPHESQLSDGTVARVFWLTQSQTPQQMESILIAIRSIADTQKVFTVPDKRAITMRNIPERAALAAWIVSILDADGPQHETRYRFVLPNDPDDTVRVFYLAKSLTDDEQTKIAQRARTSAGIGRWWLDPKLGALILRGAEAQIAAAQRELEKTKAR